MRVYDRLTGTPYQVSEAGSALRVAVGRGRQHRPVERVCVKRQRLQRLQQPELYQLRLRTIYARFMRKGGGY